MKPEPQRPEGREGIISALNEAITAVNFAEKNSNIPPAKVVFRSVSALLATNRDTTVGEPDYIELGFLCADICRTLDRGTSGKRLEELHQSFHDAVNLLTVIVADIRRELVKCGNRNVISRRFRARSDRGTLAAWKLELNGILQAFNKEPTDAIISPAYHRTTTVSNSHRNALKTSEDRRHHEQRTHASAPGELPHPPLVATRATASQFDHNVARTRVLVSEIHRTIVQGQGGNGVARPSIPGEPPPLPPRTFFGRDELIGKVVDLVENFVPLALIGAGGIGKTSIALAVLHHDRVKQRFGNNRRFIRCDQFPPSRAHLLRRLSEVTGIGVENPKSLTPLRSSLSSREMLIVLDNAESILDPQGANAQDTYAAVEELSRFNNICVCITSRISTTPPDIKHLDVPTLSVDAARDTFYRIYDTNDRSDLVDDILEQLDFHPLSITLLATVARQNRWTMSRLAREWGRRRTSVLQTEHRKSLAATIGLSLTSPLFQDLGPDARALLEVIAFFPQGIDENNLDWLFPTIPNVTDIFDRFCVLSLTYWSNGFITMLAPLRDYLSPDDPKSSSLLCATRDRYFGRLSVRIDPDAPGFRETRWITSEDVNVEHLLDVFTTIDPSSDATWEACNNFIIYLYWHKKRLTILVPKIEGLPDNHRFKPNCLFGLSRLFESVGNQVDRERLLTHALRLWRERGSDHRVAQMLRHLSDASRLTGHPKEGIQLAKKALEVYEQLGDVTEQAWCLKHLAYLLRDDKQLDAAEEAASRAIELSTEKGQQFLVCESYRILGDTYQSKGEIEKAIHHNMVALDIASSFNWHDLLFWIHYNLAELFRDEGSFDDAHAHLERAKSHTVDRAYYLGRATELQASVWHKQHKLEEAKSEASHAADIYEKLGAAKDVDDCRNLIQRIEKELSTPVSPGPFVFGSQGTER